MKKSVLAAVMLILLLSSCDKIKTVEIEYRFEPYTAFTGVDLTGEVLLDNGITLDGVLDDEIWDKSSTAIEIAGVTKDASADYEDIDVEVFGQRGAMVYTYIGEHNIYFAFEVEDKNLYYNPIGSQSASTCVELYFTSKTQESFADGCYSVRINPTGKAGADAVNIGIYIPNDSATEWTDTVLRGKAAAAVRVIGRVCNQADDESYSTEDNVGYVMEVAISKSLIGEDADAIRFTAAFVQDKGYDLPRLGNSFISGTSYKQPDTWVIMTNDGQIQE